MAETNNLGNLIAKAATGGPMGTLTALGGYVAGKAGMGRKRKAKKLNEEVGERVDKKLAGAVPGVGQALEAERGIIRKPINKGPAQKLEEPEPYKKPRYGFGADPMSFEQAKGTDNPVAAFADELNKKKQAGDRLGLVPGLGVLGDVSKNLKESIESSKGLNMVDERMAETVPGLGQASEAISKSKQTPRKRRKSKPLPSLPSSREMNEQLGRILLEGYRPDEIRDKFGFDPYGG